MSSDDEGEVAHILAAVTTNTRLPVATPLTFMQRVLKQPWGAIIVIVALLGTHFRLQLRGLLQQIMPSTFEWLKTKVASFNDSAVQEAKPSGDTTKQQKVVVAKLIAMGAKVYGSMHCSWTRRQLEIIGVDIKSSLFVDCDTDGTSCANIQAFPTWTIQGKTEPGFLPLDALEMIADGVLLAAFKKPLPITTTVHVDDAAQDDGSTPVEDDDDVVPVQPVIPVAAALSDEATESPIRVANAETPIVVTTEVVTPSVPIDVSTIALASDAAVVVGVQQEPITDAIDGDLD
jgi:hypothetical protein